MGRFWSSAENAAIENNVHPNTWTRQNIAYMRAQLKRLGYSYDWCREFATCDPDYYKWEQQIFIEMLEKGLAEKQKAWVNWCDKCNTVLANEQVEDGYCWRHSDTLVRQRQLEQWFFKITKYAEELLECTEKLPGWPEKVLLMQRNWIGKSVGAMIQFKLERPYPDPDTNGDLDRVVVYTTRPDTLYGATFMSLAAEHPLCEILSKGTDQEESVKEFCEKVRNDDKIKRSSDDYAKEGVFTGAYCTNPMTGRRMPIYVANFVLMDYGTGAVMAVPAHDQRDFEFAKVYGLDIVPVVQPKDQDELKTESMTEAYEGPGTMFNSDEYDGMDNVEFKKAISDRLEKEMKGGASVNYRIRDWLISRQRFWGAPIPVIHCDICGIVPVPKKDLPVELPAQVEFDVEKGNPLPHLDWWVNVKCPKCGKPSKRETDTMDTFMESSWYPMRYTGINCETGPFDEEEVHYWMPVDHYIGGIEHAVMHLLYARFYTKILRDLGYIKFDEPFTNLLTQGMVLMEIYKCPEHGFLVPKEVKDNKCPICGAEVTVEPRKKMSKSKKNTVDPEDMVNKYGADTMRLYLLFEAPPDKEIDWSEDRIQGMSRFISRIWAFSRKHMDSMKNVDSSKLDFDLENAPEDEAALYRKTNVMVKEVTDRIERWTFNTAIAGMMELFNQFSGFDPAKGESKEARYALMRYSFERFMMLLAPFSPHLVEELWSELGNETCATALSWPGFDQKALIEDTFTLVLQVNGKVRAKVEAPMGAGKDELEKIAFTNDRIKEYTDGKDIRKVIAVPNKLVNVVV